MDTNGGFGIGDVLEIRVFSCAFVVVNAPARGLHLCPCTSHRFAKTQYAFAFLLVLAEHAQITLASPRLASYHMGKLSDEFV